jgi:hypothetical protein
MASGLLQHHVALRRHLGLDEVEVAHAVRLHDHGGLEMLLGEALEVVGGIVRGDGVVAPAEPRHHAGELAGFQFLGRPEHQVLEEVGDPRLPRRVVGTADAIPHDVRDDRRAVVGHHDHVHAVGEIELAGASLGGFRGHRCDRQQGEREAGGRQQRPRAAASRLGALR